MTNVSVTKPYQRRRRFSREFKAEILAQCQEPGASVSRVALDNGLNTNMVRRWISEARRAGQASSAASAFVPLSLPAASPSRNPTDPRRSIRIEIPRVGGAVVVEWPAEQAHQCAALLRDLLG
ncbi:IS66-like element accessory protein TnpA [Hydrocarboniclastica marina]|uniref:Transposase n=1 Tax=Hydrocarboniclastica marina TaxID=2259620 RepID=A0A4P7XHH0_9ALTE|nr:transposase [Hydrocarboniclastica marina]QCF26481.1 IS66 family insertion sequence hypothetical protein [Hydrocarboniclastica marina]